MDGHVVVLWDGLPRRRSPVVKDFAGKHVTGSPSSGFFLLPSTSTPRMALGGMKWNRVRGFCPSTLHGLRSTVWSSRRLDVMISLHVASSLPPIGDG